MSAKLLATNAFWSLLSHLLSRGTLMLSAVILARTLDTTSFATYSYFQITVAMLSAYASMGLGVSASRFFAASGRVIHEANTPPLGTVWCLSLLLSVAACFTVLFIPSQWISTTLSVPRWLLAVGVLAVGLTVVPSGAILGLERYKQASLVSALAGAVLMLGVWHASELGSPNAAIGAVVFSVLLQAIGESWVVIRSIGWTRVTNGFRLRRKDVGYVFSFAGPMFFVTLISASGTWLLGNMILNGQGGAHAFALYVIGLQWFSLGLLLPGMFSRVILPRLVANTGLPGSKESNKKLVLQGALMATCAALGMTLAGVLFGPWIISIYGNNYSADRWFIGAFLGAAIFSAPANTLGNAIVASDGQKAWLLLTIIWIISLLVTAEVTASMEALSGAVAQASAACILTVIAFVTAKLKRLI